MGRMIKSVTAAEALDALNHSKHIELHSAWLNAAQDEFKAAFQRISKQIAWDIFYGGKAIIKRAYRGIQKVIHNDGRPHCYNQEVVLIKWED